MRRDGAGLRGRRARLRARPGGGRLPPAEPPGLRGYVERFILDDAPRRLSPAALETLAIIAYKQPISPRPDRCDPRRELEGVVRVLVERGYVRAVGHDDGPGLAVLFGTTESFLERLGLNSLVDLPPLERFVPDVATVEGFEQVLRAGPGGLSAEAPEGIRLQKVLARVGFGSRRLAEELIEAGRVKVNGERAVLGRRVDPRQTRWRSTGFPSGSSLSSSTCC